MSESNSNQDQCCPPGQTHGNKLRGLKDVFQFFPLPVFVLGDALVSPCSGSVSCIALLDVVGTAKSWRNSSWWEIGLWIWCCSWSLHVAEEEKLVID